MVVPAGLSLEGGHVCLYADRLHFFFVVVRSTQLYILFVFSGSS